MKPEELFGEMKKLRILTKKQINSLFSGLYRSFYRGPGMDFQEVREYTDGDDFRLLDWNVSSRMNSLHTKVFAEERELSLMLITDVSASLGSGPFSAAKKRMLILVYSLLAYAACLNNDKVGAAHVSSDIEKFILPRKGSQHVLSMMYEILTCPFNGKGSNLNLGLTTVLKHLKRRGICVILSDFKTTLDPGILSLLCRKHQVTAVMLWDDKENRFPADGLLECADPESGARSRCYGGTEAYRQAYAGFWEKTRLERLRQLSASGVRTLVLGTEEDPFVRLKYFLSRGAAW
ncbi:MAG: DUF58 domain-containing protein [Spirochaetales bacterium]|nr:MAG: DUF58 domain-containing protein [Spirochaetales bacterium]